MSEVSYKDAGVDIEVGNDIVSRIKPLVSKTFSKQVQTELGSFAGVYDLKALCHDYDHPMLVQSMDGVGTKMMLAAMMQKFDTIGIDLVSATTNDIIVMGAKPLTLLDYIAAESLCADATTSIIAGIAKACHEHGIALIGGETAEMPGTYKTGELDLAGVITGVVEKEHAILGKNIKPGDLVYGVASSGLHTNGYSLARKLCFEVAGYKPESYIEDLGATIGETLLEPHLNYTSPIQTCLEQGIAIKGMAHISGGGLIENIPRILPQGTAVEIKQDNFEISNVFQLLKSIGSVSDAEMWRTFNMGIGLVILLDGAEASALEASFKALPNFNLSLIGEVIPSNHATVRII